jgi:TRAP-type mannitol/chloroaromatic compound transport system permease large subunit
MANDTLLAVPFFTLMGLILERSGMAEDLLDTVGQVFGPMRAVWHWLWFLSAHCWQPPPVL